MSEGPPGNSRKDVSYEMHGEEIFDPFRWLEEDSEEVEEWVRRQNSHAKRSLENEIREELRPRLEDIKEFTDHGNIVPSEDGYYQVIRRPGEEKPALYHRESPGSDPEKVIDPNEMDGDVSMEEYFVSGDGSRIAYLVNRGGSEMFDIKVHSTEEDEIVDEVPDVGRGHSVEWDGDGFYYVRTGEEDQLDKEVRYRELNGDDRSVFTRFGPREWPVLETSEDGEHVIVGTVDEDHNSELYYSRDGESFEKIELDGEGLFLPLMDGEDLYVLTDAGAPNRKVMRGEPGPEPGLEDFIPERDRQVLEEFEVRNGSLGMVYLDGGTHRLEVEEEGERREIELPGEGTVESLDWDRDGERLFFRFTSFDQPSTQYMVEEKEREELFRNERGFDTELEVSREEVESGDGTEIPLFVVHREDLERDGDNPALLYGYGGFGKAMTPRYTRHVMPFLSDGGVYAVPALRGGGEFGREWHEKAKKQQKQRTFDDFIASAEHLISGGYTDTSKLAAEGGSNGGLTVSASVVQRPELFAAGIAHVPLTDMLRFDRYEIGDLWTGEYGSPGEEDEFRALKGYSPYHNISNDDYPAMLFTTAENDTRVHPMHARKMAARMQENTTSSDPVLLRTYSDSGHTGGAGISQAIEQILDDWTFIYGQLGVEPGEK